jgi:hypothetical protein
MYDLGLIGVSSMSLLQKDLVFKEGVAIYIRSAAYFEFVLNLQGEVDRVGKLVRDLEVRIVRIGHGIDGAAVAAAERKQTTGAKGMGSGKGKKGKAAVVQVDDDSDDGELERLAAELKKLKQRKVRQYTGMENNYLTRICVEKYCSSLLHML